MRPARCPSCGAAVTGSVCPSCLRRPERERPAARKREPAAPPRVAPPVEASRVEAQRHLRVATGTRLDAWLGGLPAGVSLLYGEPGAGKSSLALLAAPRPAVVLSAEMTAAECVATAREAGADLAGLWVWEDPPLSAVADYLAEHPETRSVVVDSVPRVTVPGLDLGSERAQLAVMREGFRWARGGRVVLCLHHATRDGGRAGPRSLEHDVSAVLTLERDPRRLVCVKVRGSAPGCTGGRLPAPLSAHGARPWACVPKPPRGVAGRALRRDAEREAADDGVPEDPAPAELDRGLDVGEAAPVVPDGAHASGEPGRAPEGDQ